MCDVSTCYNNRPCLVAVKGGPREEGAHRGERTSWAEHEFHFKPTSTGVHAIPPPRPPSLPPRQHTRQMQLTHTRYHRARFPSYPKTQYKKTGYSERTSGTQKKQKTSRESNFMRHANIYDVYSQKSQGFRREKKRRNYVTTAASTIRKTKKEGRAPVCFRGRLHLVASEEIMQGDARNAHGKREAFRRDHTNRGNFHLSHFPAGSFFRSFFRSFFSYTWYY